MGCSHFEHTLLGRQVYGALVAACGQAIAATGRGRRREQLVLLERSAAVVADMRVAGIRPDRPIWNALITAAGRAAHLERAFHALEDMQVGREWLHRAERQT